METVFFPCDNPVYYVFIVKEDHILVQRYAASTELSSIVVGFPVITNKDYRVDSPLGICTGFSNGPSGLSETATPSELPVMQK